ncbi:hypothetical protein [Sphingobacterium multivorum]|uniref:hypothetical protein n=1 Tax=Sphingobacterium multivorum TaxID=28454 RepID=UPI000F9D6FA2|nr:hypothetical protein [Sphingobacterium multivorum]
MTESKIIDDYEGYLTKLIARLLKEKASVPSVAISLGIMKAIDPIKEYESWGLIEIQRIKAEEIPINLNIKDIADKLMTLYNKKKKELL